MKVAFSHATVRLKTSLTCCCRLMHGDQARFFEDEIREHLKHKLKGTVAMASASRSTTFACLPARVSWTTLLRTISSVLGLHVFTLKASLPRKEEHEILHLDFCQPCSNIQRLLSSLVYSNKTGTVFADTAFPCAF